MRSSINNFVKLIFFETIFLIVFLETTFFVSSITRRNVFLNFSCCFLISNDLNSNRTWKVFVCIANTNFFVDKIFVLTIKLTYVYEVMFSMFLSRTKSFSMFILFVVSEFEKNWLFFFIKNKTNNNSSFFFSIFIRILFSIVYLNVNTTHYQFVYIICDHVYDYWFVWLVIKSTRRIVCRILFIRFILDVKI